MLDALSHLAISPSGFIFDPSSGATFTTNDTGRALLEGIRDGRSLDELVAQLEETFQVYGSDLRRDVLEFVRVLQDEGLLDRDFELE
ncbi:MAG: PqqD family protein [Alphaproteobacteria bacterium]|nr:PqqD family protein [Alphaproteobacteria bacterium]